MESIRKENDKNLFYIVDDDPFILELIKNSLVQYGHVKTFQTTQNLLQSYQEDNPDILFLDIHLGKESGITLLEQIIAMDPKASVHMLSADSTVDNITTCIRLGARSFISKPISNNKILEALKRCPTIRQKNDQ